MLRLSCCYNEQIRRNPLFQALLKTVFTGEGDKIRNKEIKDYINVSVVIDIECGDTK